MSLLENAEPSTESDRSWRRLSLVLVAITLVLLATIGYLGHQTLDHLEAVDERIGELSTRSLEATEASEQALAKATEAETAARAAAEGRLLAEAESERAKEDAGMAREEADEARDVADVALREADEAQAEAERIRREVEAELKRLEEALGKIADTKRTALGLVMNLGEDALKFDFDQSELRSENRELLARITGILLTSPDYTISVNGHTDDVGSSEYNMSLSERRAQAVYDYLLESDLPEGRLTVQGWGKSKPLVEGTSEAARAKNRRVELGIVNARVKYAGRVN
jgi:outer membrane protein OmpA-like peptidoglycan-associated protein